MSAAGRINTASLRAGTRILVTVQGDGTLELARRKTGAAVATVQRLDRVAPGPYGRQSRYQITTDLGTLVTAPIQTHWLAKEGT